MALQTPHGDFFVQNSFNGNVLQQEPETNAVVLKPRADQESSQIWYRDGNFLKCRLTNQALTMNPGIVSTGAKLYVASCHWSPYQKWITKSGKKFRIANHMEQCLVLQAEDESNVKVMMERWNDDPKQLWTFVPVGETDKEIRDTITQQYRMQTEK